MRELTFAGFLKEYVKGLSEYDTNSLYRLAAEASSSNARLREPLLLYAVCCDKSDVFRTATEKCGLASYYGELLAIGQGEVVDALSRNALPAEYQKVWDSYLARKNRHSTDNATKELMRNRILSLQTKNGVTNYRIYTDLRLNPGNLNAWLKHGDGNKVSLDTARSVLNYIRNMA